MSTECQLCWIFFAKGRDAQIKRRGVSHLGLFTFSAFFFASLNYGVRFAEVGRCLSESFQIIIFHSGDQTSKTGIRGYCWGADRRSFSVHYAHLDAIGDRAWDHTARRGGSRGNPGGGGGRDFCPRKIFLQNLSCTVVIVATESLCAQQISGQIQLSNVTGPTVRPEPWSFPHPPDHPGSTQHSLDPLPVHRI